MKLLIIRAGALGDTLMLMPLINALPNDQISILGRKPGIDFLESYAAHCIDIERGGWHNLFSGESDIDISCPQVDHVIAFINDRDNIVFENINKLLPDAKINIFPPFPGPDSETHVAVHMLRSLQSSGIAVDPQEAFNAAVNQPAMGSGKAKGKRIVLHPGSGSKKKNYSPDLWIDLAARIKNEIQDPSGRMCFLLGPAEEDLLPLMEKNAEELGTETVIPDKEELLAILNKTNLYFGHDSGVTHLAAMLGINTIAIFKNSSVSQWRPLGPSVKIIGADGDKEDIIEMILDEAFALLKRQV